MQYVKPFLKWPGGKIRSLKPIQKYLTEGSRLIEPFVGSGSVFLNTNYPKYLLADINPDLINLYLYIQKEGQSFIDDCRSLFIPKNNKKEKYIKIRSEFNTSEDLRLRSILFIYLNRHCYNGLCRYNNDNKFNTPFGSYQKPYFPEKELISFHKASQKAKFILSSFQDTLKKSKKGDVVYCDPPYVPLSKTSYFTSYFSNKFSWGEQVKLTQLAGKLSKKGIPVVISNHDTKHTQKLYSEAGAFTENFLVRRMISCKPRQRNKVEELIAVFQ